MTVHWPSVEHVLLDMDGTVLDLAFDNYFWGEVVPARYAERKGINAYGSFNYDIGNGMRWFADVQLGHHRLGLYRDVTAWSYQAPDGNEEGYFYNQATEQVEYWQRQFSPEEMGGLGRGMIENRQKTFSLATGLQGQFGEAWAMVHKSRAAGGSPSADFVRMLRARMPEPASS